MKNRSGVSTSVKVGNVGGSIVNSPIAAGNVSVSGTLKSSLSGSKAAEATLDDLAALLKQIQAELAELATHKVELTTLSAAAPSRVEGAKISLAASIPKVTATAKSEDKKSVLREVTDAESSVSHILSNAKNIIKDSSKLAKSAGPLIELLSPLHEHLLQASQWISQFWS